MASLLRASFHVHRACSQTFVSVVASEKCFVPTFVRKICQRWSFSSQRKLHTGTLSRHPDTLLVNEKYEVVGSEMQILDRLVSDGREHSLSASDMIRLSKDIFHAKYSTLRCIPWLQENSYIAFIQLVMNKKLHVMDPLWKHEGMAILVSNVIDHNEHLDARELGEIVSSLLYLGMDPTSNAAQKLFSRTSELLPTMDIHSLEVWHTNWKLIDREWHILRPLLLQFKKLLQDPTLEWGLQEVYSLASIAVNSCNLYSLELLHLTSGKLYDVLNNSDFNITADQLGTYSRMGKVYFLATRYDKVKTRQIIGKIVDRCPSLMDQMTPQNIAEICSALRMCNCYERDLGILFGNKAHSLLREDMKSSEVSNLMYSLKRNTYLDIKRRFENVMMHKINDVDVLLVCNLAQNLLSMGSDNQDLIFALQEQIVNHGEGIIAYGSRFSKILRFLRHKKFLSAEHEKDFTELVLKSVDKDFLSYYFPSGNYVEYLLPISRDAIDERLFHMLLKAVPRWREKELFKLTSALNKMRQPSTLRLQQQIGQIQSVLHQALSDKLEKADKIDFVFYVGNIHSLAMRSHSHDPVLTNKIMQRFLHFTHSLTDVHACHIARLCRNINFCLPQLYEALVTFLVKRKESVSETKIKGIIDLCGNFGHISQDSEGFLEVALKGYHLFAKKGMLLQQLRMLRNMTLCQLFPEEELNDVFHIDFIKKLDSYIEEIPQSRSPVEFLMMVLNRSVVLECPQLNIPWFHQDYSFPAVKEVFSGEISDVPGTFFSRFQDDVSRALAEVLHGERFIRRNVLSPYYHRINFECILDSNKKPVPIQDISSTVLPDWQRVAVLVLSKRHYCCNAQYPIGSQLMCKRHLEILGYKVIEVPVFEWNSMRLSDWQAKVDYLHEKIYS